MSDKDYLQGYEEGYNNGRKDAIKDGNKIADDLHDYVIATSYLDDDDIMILSSIEKRIRGIK